MPQDKAPVPMAKKTMPHRSHHAAPRFDGKSASLSSFWDDVEELAELCELTQKETIKWATRYSPSIDRELWEMQESVETGDWERFKEEIYDLYPGSKGEYRYSAADLQALVHKQKSITIRDAEGYGVYHRSFSKISRYLRSKSRLSDREAASYFLQGLEPSFRHEIQAQLKAEDPKRHSDDHYTLDEIKSAAIFHLSCHHQQIYCLTGTPYIRSTRTESRGPSVNPVQIKSQEENDPIIVNAKPIMEIQQDTEREKYEMVKRMDKPQDIRAKVRSKKEPEVSSLKKSDSNTISNPQYRYISPDDNSSRNKLASQSRDPVIIIPAQSRGRQTEQPSILAVKVDASQDIEAKPIIKENVLVLTSNKDYDTSKIPPTQEDEIPAAAKPEDDLPSVAASELVATPLPSIAEIPEIRKLPSIAATPLVAHTSPSIAEVQCNPEKTEDLPNLAMSPLDMLSPAIPEVALKPEVPEKPPEIIPETTYDLVTRSPAIAEVLRMPKKPSNCEILQDDIPKATEEKSRFLRPEKDNPAQQLEEGHHDSQTKIYKQVLNVIKHKIAIGPPNSSYKSRWFYELNSDIFELNKVLSMIKRSTEAFTSRERIQMASIFRKPEQKKLAHKFQDFRRFQAWQPKNIVPTLIMKSSAVYQEGVG